MGEILRKATGDLAYANDFIKYTKLELNDIKHTFFKIGFRLNEAEEFSYYAELGYADIYELAKAEFGFEKTTTKNLMAINRTYSEKIHNGHYRSYSMKLGDVYDKYSQTQLVEMLPLTVQERHYIPADMTIADIRDYKKALKEPYGWRSEKLVNPKATAEEYRKWYTTIGSKPEVKKEALDIPQGQLVLSDDGNVTEFHQTGAEEKLQEILEQAKEIEPVEIFNPGDDEVSNEEMAERNRAFIEEEREREELARVIKSKDSIKDKDEILDFITDKENYSTIVLDNKELGLVIRRLDFENGLQLFRTETRLVDSVVNQEWITYCLVYKGNDLPSELYKIPKVYNSSNCQLSYIVNAIKLLNTIF